MGDEITVRWATMPDLPWIAAHDGHLGEGILAGKVADGEVAVAALGDEPAGLLRFDRLWSSVPFIALVRVAEPARRRGVGRALVTFLADQARAEGAAFVLSSATGDEHEPIAWHRALGFEQCGTLAGINDGGVDEVVYRLVL